MTAPNSTARAATDAPRAALERWPRPAFWLALVLVVSAGVVRSYFATRHDGLQIDEAWHTVAGVSYDRTGDFRLNPEHPPLVKLWVGLNLPKSVFALAPFRPLADKADERTFIDDVFYLDNDPDAIQARMRLAMLAFHAALLLALGLAAERVFGSLIAVWVVALLLIDPTVAAHMPVVLTDLPLCLLAAISALAAYVAFRTFRAFDVLLAAVALGMALAAKHSAVAVAIAIGLLGLGMCVLGQRRRDGIRWPRRFGSLAAVAVGAYLTLWAFYGFRFAEHPHGQPAFGDRAAPALHASEALDAPLLFNRPLQDKITDLQSPLHRTLLTQAHDLHLLPRAYLWGLADIVRAGIDGREEVSYVFGKRLIRLTPWYFFPAVLTVKVPLGMIALVCIGVGLCLRRRVAREWLAPSLAIAACAGVFMLFIMRGNSGYAGVRHVLPVFPALAVCAALAIAVAIRSRSLSLRIASGVALMTALASAAPSVRPWEYYNELAGGTEHAWHGFNDDGLDNGQRSKDLVAYYNAHLRGTGEPVYDFYGLYENQKKAFKLDIRSLASEPLDSEFITGTVFVTTRWLQPRPVYDCEPFRRAEPVARVGNLLVLRGTFRLPWLPAFRRRARIDQALAPGTYDPTLVEQLLREITAIYPEDYQASFELGNLLVERGATEPAIHAYALSRRYAPPEDGMLATLTSQIEALSRHASGAGRVQPLRNPWLE